MKPYLHRFMKDFLTGDSPEEVTQLVLSTISEFSMDLRNTFPMDDYDIEVVPIDTWDKVKGEKILILPYSELTGDGKVYFHTDDIRDAMENPDLETIKLILWEMLLTKTGYLIYKNYEQARKLEFKNDLVIISSILSTATLIAIDDIKTISAVLDAKREIIKLDLRTAESLLNTLEFMNFDAQKIAYEDARAKIIRASAQLLDAAVMNWMVIQSISIAPLIDPREEIERFVKEGIFAAENLSERIGEIFSGIWAFYDILKVMGKDKPIELIELRDKIMEYRQRLGLDYQPSTQDFSEKLSVG
ncbi:hypothetical protein [Thermococcus chitonophagus]|uniref:Uncharacterized protein n=2 Tax=Thermococcus chitonophagus TaxID=54262 RepID=A0A160VVK0_9EURY|nr:hypothetical protein [Thermococcus chitonophagus]CUX77801.1 hypothetical protein CHITON_1022 [Thermococcus chitonophagus]